MNAFTALQDLETKQKVVKLIVGRPFDQPQDPAKELIQRANQCLPFFRVFSFAVCRKLMRTDGRLKLRVFGNFGGPHQLP